MRIEIQTTCPPSVNNAFGNRKDGKGRYRRQAYNEWMKMVGEDIRRQNIGILEGPFRVDVFSERSHHARDVDNILKGCLDALQNHCVIMNDNQCFDARARWFRDKNGNPVKGSAATIVLEALS